ncbi:MBL fold metallo-hydrolase [Telmatospirillum siberiense]|uniref:Uncharacterized protein n=1 Tax=Telmatospirillum siberiense TaxID=382514 RepID=A0A2N3PNH7_9PROT|nr:MBL fold metallo-hydrolase [Telmatospirillum siberiense]PKU21963.1 hypothetical protein CWS72_23965 [Telmatospirillum siberiense]
MANRPTQIQRTPNALPARDDGIVFTSLCGSNPKDIGGNCLLVDLYGTKSDGTSEHARILIDNGKYGFNANADIRYRKGNGKSVEGEVEGAFVDIRPWLVDPKTGVTPSGEPKIDAILITHAHQDHLPGPAYLAKMMQVEHQDLVIPPIYSSSYTAEQMKELSVFKRLPEELRDAVTPVVVKPGSAIPDLGESISVKMQPVNHTPGARRVLMSTPAGSWLHTADTKSDPTQPFREPGATMSFGGIPDLKVISADSTSAGKTGPQPSETDIGRTLSRIIKDNGDKTVVVGVLGTNMGRVATVVRAALSEGRTPVLDGSSLRTNAKSVENAGWSWEETCGIERRDIPDRRRVQALLDDGSLKLSDLVVITTGSFAQPNTGLDLIASGRHPFVTAGADVVVVNSQGKIPNVVESVTAMESKIAAAGALMINPEKSVKLGYGPLHRSGHYGEEELKAAAGDMDPDVREQVTFVPVHGGPDLIAKNVEAAHVAGFKNILDLPVNGVEITMDRDGVRESGEPHLPNMFVAVQTSQDWRYPRWDFVPLKAVPSLAESLTPVDPEPEASLALGR